jgi:hypothetical protein
MSETPHAANLKALRHPTVIIGGLLFLGLLVLIGHYAIQGVKQRPERLLKAEVELYRISPRLDPFKTGMRIGVSPEQARATLQACPAERWQKVFHIRAPRTLFYRCTSGGAAVLGRVYYPEDFSDPEVALSACGDPSCPAESVFPRLGLKVPQPKS